MRAHILVLFLVAVCFLADRAHAGYIIQFSTDPSVNHFDVAVGSTLDVGIYVAQTAPSSALTDFGLISVGLGITFDPTKIQIDGANPFTFSGNFPSGHDVAFSNGTLRIYGESLFNNVGANPGPVPFKGDTILIGTLSLQTLVAGNFNVSVGDYEPSAPDFADFGLGGLGANTNFDKLLFGNNTQGTFQFSAGLTAVPEPSSILLLGSLVIACGVRFRLRARRSSETDAISPLAPFRGEGSNVKKMWVMKRSFYFA